jgi:hypothetical protein
MLAGKDWKDFQSCFNYFHLSATKPKTISPENEFCFQNDVLQKRTKVLMCTPQKIIFEKLVTSRLNDNWCHGRDQSSGRGFS